MSESRNGASNKLTLDSATSALMAVGGSSDIVVIGGSARDFEKIVREKTATRRVDLILTINCPNRADQTGRRCER